MKKHFVLLLLAFVMVVAIVAVPAQAAETDLAKLGQQVIAEATALAFPADGKDLVVDCPACGKKNVTWTALKDTDANQKLTDGQHVYLYEDISVTGSFAAISGTGSNGKVACLHLNGKTVSSSGYYAILETSGVLNIMGDGYVTGNKGGTTYGSAVHINGSGKASAVNIYGGTYSQLKATQTSNVLAVYGNGGMINMYGGTVVASGSGSAVYLNGEMDYTSALFNMYGGTIDATATNEIAIDMEAADTLNSTSGSNAGRAVVLAFNMYGGEVKGSSAGTLVARKNGVVNISGGTVTGGVVTENGGSILIEAEGSLHISGGTITGGSATCGGNVCIAADGTGTMSGGVISDGVASSEGGNLYVAGNFTMTGGTVQDGNAADGGNMFLYSATTSIKNATISGGTTTSAGGNIVAERGTLSIGEGTQILNGHAGGKGGSLRAYLSTVIMTGGTISGGNADGGIHNVWVVAGSSAACKFYMLGGTIDCADNRNDSAIYLSGAKGELYLGGNATITDTNKKYAGISKKDDASKVFICDGWSGSADIKFPTNYECGATIPAEVAQLVTLDQDLKATIGGSYIGKLTQRNTTVADIIGNADGTLQVIGAAMVAADGTQVISGDPLTDWTSGNYIYIKLFSNSSFEDLCGSDIQVDLNGYDLTVGGTGVLHAFDTANDTYKASACGTVINNGSVTIAENVLSPVGYQYIAITNGTKTTMHRLDMRIDSVSLRTTAAGIYYKAIYTCDTTLEAAVKTYGVVLSTHNMPGKNFLAEEERSDVNRYTVARETFKSGVVATSGSVFGIMKDTRTAALNTQYGEVKIYANPYICLSENGTKIYVSDNLNADKTVADEAFDGVAYSLRDVLELLDDSYYLYTDDVRHNLDQFYFDWKDKGMSWSFENIGDTDAQIDNSDLVFEEGTNLAVCPVCRTTQEWKLLSGDEAVVAQAGDHYYLGEDITYTGAGNYFFRAPASGGVACLHLQKYHLTATGTSAIYGYQGTLNVIGTGKVTGYTEDEAGGAAVFINTGATKGVVNLYGGTYTKTDTCTTGAVAAIGTSGGKINVYAQAKILGSGSGYSVYVDAATRAAARFGVHGGTVTGGEICFAGSADKVCSLDVTGNAKISNVVIPLNATANLSGSPVIDRLELSTGVQVTLGKLTQGASVTVQATDVFTTTSDMAADYAAYFHPVVATDVIQAENNALRYIVNYEPYLIPWELDAVAQAKADKKVHYYFMAGEGLIANPGSAQEDKWGDSCLIVFPNGETMLIDAGMRNMAPVLWMNLERLGITTLDHLMITHYHNDHYGGVFGYTLDGVNFEETEFLDHITVKHVYHHGIQASNHYGYQLVAGVCAERNIPTTLLERGMVETVGGLPMEVIWPNVGANQSTISTGQINDSSIVVRFDYGEHSSLLTGDVYVAGETEILGIVDHAKLDVDLLKVPHHGWSTSSSVEFIEAISPELGVITGRQEKIETIKARYASLGVSLLADIDYGYVHISADAEGNMEYETSRNG